MKHERLDLLRRPSGMSVPGGRIVCGPVRKWTRLKAVLTAIHIHI